MGNENFDDLRSGGNKSNQQTAKEKENSPSNNPSGRKYEAAEQVAANSIVDRYASGGAYSSSEPAAITQMKQMAAKKAVEHVVDNNNPFE